MSLDALMNLAEKRVADLANDLVCQALQEVLSTAQVTFIIGSGVSLFPPTSVVNGLMVTRALAQELSKCAASRLIIRRYISSSAFENVLQGNPANKPIEEWLLRLFSTENKQPNAIHKAIALSLAAHRADIVTTNYDRFLEMSMDELQIDYHAVISERQAEHLVAPITYFKIHGCTSVPNSLVYKLEHEPPLIGWKSKLFRSLINNRIVLIIGYSGKDFEICPALLAQKPKAILWNMYSADVDQGRFSSENAEHLYKNSQNMIVLRGDMHRIFSVQPKAPSEVDKELLGRFIDGMTESERVQWHVNAMNSIGAPRQMHHALHKNGELVPKQFLLDGIASVDYHRGRYLSSVFGGIRAMAFRARGEGRAGLLLRCGLDAAFKLRNRTNHRLARLSFAVAGAGWSQCRFALKREYAASLSWFDALDLARSLPRSKSRLSRRLRQTQYFGLRRGAWGHYYNARDYAESLQMSGSLQADLKAPPLPSSFRLPALWGNVFRALNWCLRGRAGTAGFNVQHKETSRRRPSGRSKSRAVEMRLCCLAGWHET